MESSLEPKRIGNIKGEFLIPSYQRGYRWKEEQVELLLQDIFDNVNSNNTYSLQPIVVKKIGDHKYELIDGQQRLTTIFLIQRHLMKFLPQAEVKYTLDYSTRERSAAYLREIKEEQKKDNIDFFHMYSASSAIAKWFDSQPDQTNAAIKLYSAFNDKVEVIWYEVESKEDKVKDEKESIELFTRLNIGKIPLTNAELVKALFLSQDENHLKYEKQIEIATKWDAIEQELHNPSLWAFLTNDASTTYPTRIELIFNMMSKKPKSEREEFFTFYHFADEIKKHGQIEVWKSIEEYFSLLKEWFLKRDLYHKVGFLIATGSDINRLKEESGEMPKSQFKASLDRQIQEKLNLTKGQFESLSYEKSAERKKLNDVLLLFNVESVRRLKGTAEKYDFAQHKSNTWSLEHIHAQNAQGLNKEVEQKDWLDLHIPSLESLFEHPEKGTHAKELVVKINEAYRNLSKSLFEELFNETLAILSESEDRSYADTIENLALLSSSNNSALSNSIFDVKRKRILELDRRGKYIPLCTRRLFLKYYTTVGNGQLQFWTETDRKAYMEAMVGEEGMITSYLLQDKSED